MIDLTRNTVTSRASSYRWLVVAVLLGGGASVAAALALRQPVALLPLSWLPATVLLFYTVDIRAVQRWRDQAVADWSAGELRLDHLAQTLRQVPNLPLGTVTGMLETLPAWDHSVPEPARPALATAQSTLSSVAVQAMAIRALTWSLAAAALSSWLLSAGRFALAFVLMAPMLWGTWRLSCYRSLLECERAWRSSMLDTHANGRAWHAQVNCEGLPPWLKGRWHGSLT